MHGEVSHSNADMVDFLDHGSLSLQVSVLIDFRVLIFAKDTAEHIADFSQSA